MTAQVPPNDLTALRIPFAAFRQARRHPRPLVVGRPWPACAGTALMSAMTDPVQA
jgi:hypothetical protein